MFLCVDVVCSTSTVFFVSKKTLNEVDGAEAQSCSQFGFLIFIALICII